MTSIRRQLLLWLLGGMVAGTSIGAVATYLRVREEASELFDGQLREIAVSLPAGPVFTPRAPRDADPEEDVVVRIWGSGGGAIYDSQPAVVVPRAARQGFSSVVAPDGRGRVDVAIFQLGDESVLRVVDDGPGIEPAERARIFDRFYRGRNAQGSGSGLGLAIVKRIVERHAATIDLADAAGGRGLAVTVAFPVAKDAA